MQNRLKRLWLAAGMSTLAASFLNLPVIWGQTGTDPYALRETFESTSGLESAWVQVISGDFDTAIVEVVNSSAEGKLRLAAATLGTNPKTIKFLGIRSLEPIKIQMPYQVSWTLDWNDQINGSYLSAGLLISPHATGTRPTNEPDWLQMSYVGVPPGKNARLEVTGQFSGNRKTYFTEGWPVENRSGRKISLQSLDLLISESGLEFMENGKSVFQSKQTFPFQRAYVYLFLTSHSNYNLREVYFDDVEVKKTN